ncbi:MAG: sulfate ABC transporter substrate-binding protein [Neisseria sp.]|uniref:sulfate ABC transporter substrate-binding protein n=1 Tax=Neisseria sp. TaxID=192066 RepID=UPI0026DB3909|nr:sulfate ABC transporter substrate-binding protein [Neisseria sp.]MDO4641812.1 sulfate ABC transporter substrate-binding protein [Neisseria sp.]
MTLKSISAILLAAVLTASCGSGAENGKNDQTEKPGRVSLLNVSYDPTRELYQEYNALFEKYWQQKTGTEVNIQQSNGGSGKQALAVQNGLKADVATLALAGDIDSINKNKQLINPEWQKSLPHNSTPYTSTIVFLVRKGNPKNIHDWGDLIKGDVQVITPNPKTSGGARWNFLAAWAYAQSLPNADENSAREFVKALYSRVPIMDTGARGATVSFTQRNLGDVLLAWENEAHLAINENPNAFEIITPPSSILCEPPVAMVDAVVDAKGTRQVAEGYLKHLYSPEAQRIIGKNFYRPSDPEIAKEFKQQFPDLKLVNINDQFGGWQKAQQKFFSDGAIFDQIYVKK